jgi:GH15 family glucan-1,4-alpha-glucosidase
LHLKKNRLRYQPIENYGIVGDLNTSALVGLDASVDFMCFPRFDSPTIFAALLDHDAGGRFWIAPVSGEFKNRQRYFPDTNILLTRFLGHDGVAEVSDFMAMEQLGNSQNLVRRLKVIRGEIRFRMSCAPKFDYGRAQHRIEKKPHEILFVPRGQLSALRLRSSVPMKSENGSAVTEVTLHAGQTASFVLEEAEAGQESPSQNADYVTETFKETMNYWLAWVARSNYRGRWREMVNRSALTLKLLTSQKHGSIVAAPTFGLPEHIGGSRNWDYRYTWIRDASFTLYALMRLGSTAEAWSFINWIEARCQESKPHRPLQVMYRIDGSRDLPEQILRRFEGYQKSAPVRIGNAASTQLQLDVYGELMDSIYI